MNGCRNINPTRLMNLPFAPVCLAAIWLASLLPCDAGKIHEAVAKRDLGEVDRVLKKDPEQIDARCYPDFQTPLYMAIAAGEPAIVKRLLDSGADIQKRGVDPLATTPLARAVLLASDATFGGALLKCLEGNSITGGRASQLQSLEEFGGQLPALPTAVPEAERKARLEVLALVLSRKPDLGKSLSGTLPILYPAIMTNDVELLRILIQSGANVNARDGIWSTPLHLAASREANREMMDALIAAGSDVDASDKKGKTPLMIAARAGSTIGIEVLLSHKASADAEDDQGIPAIGHAALSGHDELVRMIHQKGGPNLIRFARKEVLFQCAAMGGCKSLADILLAEGVDINIRDKDGFTPLLSAIESGHRELFDYLILKGADRKLKSNDGRSVFDIACECGHTALVKEMLDADGWPQGSPNLLSKIIRAGRVDILKLLADRKADILEIGPIFAEGGVDALQLAITGRSLSIEDNLKVGKMVTASEEDYARVVELLLERGANVNQVNRAGSTAVHLAAKACGSRVMNALLKAGGDVSLPDTNTKDTPLQIAVAFGRTETVRVLLDAGADRNVCDSRGGSLVLLAAIHGNSETLQLLIAEGMPVNSVTLKGRMAPLHGAVVVNSLESVRSLLAAGAAPDPADSTGFTPLVFAIDFRQVTEGYKKQDRIRAMICDLADRLRIIHLLLEAGVETDISSSDPVTGRKITLLDFARSNGTPEIVELLENPPPVVRKPVKR